MLRKDAGGEEMRRNGEEGREQMKNDDKEQGDEGKLRKNGERGRMKGRKP